MNCDFGDSGGKLGPSIYYQLNDLMAKHYLEQYGFVLHRTREGHSLHAAFLPRDGYVEWAVSLLHRVGLEE